MPDRSLTARARWVTPVCVAALIVIFAVCMAIGSRHTSGEEGFAGTDDAAASAAETAGAKPWFQPIFEPKSGEVESGLFALQAALGSGIVCFALGRLSGKKSAREQLAASRVGEHPVGTVPGDGTAPA